jgi:CBS domain-containing protein
MEKIN